MPEERIVVTGDNLRGLAHPLRVFYDLDTPITLEHLRQSEVEYLSSNQLPEVGPCPRFRSDQRIAILLPVSRFVPGRTVRFVTVRSGADKVVNVWSVEATWCPQLSAESTRK